MTGERELLRRGTIGAGIAAVFLVVAYALAGEPTPDQTTLDRFER